MFLPTSAKPLTQLICDTKWQEPPDKVHLPTKAPRRAIHRHEKQTDIPLCERLASLAWEPPGVPPPDRLTSLLPAFSWLFPALHTLRRDAQRLAVAKPGRQLCQTSHGGRLLEFSDYVEHVKQGRAVFTRA